MKHIYSFVIASLFSVFSFAQCSVNVNDTLLCHAGETIQISSNVSGYCKTLNYEVSTIAFNEYSLVQPYSFPMSDDDVIGPFAIGFDFKFFGTTYSQFYVGSNGWISFSGGQTISYAPKPIPSNDNTPVNSIMGPWEDWDPSVGGVIGFETIGQAPNRQLVVDFDVLGHYNCGVDPSVLGDFQIVLNENDFSIENHLKSKSACDTIKAVQGIQNSDGSRAVVVNGRNGTNWQAYYQSVRYSPSNNIYYSWESSVGDILSTDNNPVFTPQETSLITLYISDDLGCVSSDQFEIFIPTALEPFIHKVGNQLIADPSGYFYQWYLDGQPFLGETYQSITLSTHGMYTVEVTSPYTGCSYMSRVHLYASSVNVLEQLKEKIKIYPNPSSGTFSIDFIELSTTLSLKLKDIQGVLLKQFSISSSTDLNLNVPAGLYFLEFSDEKNLTYIEKITIK